METLSLSDRRWSGLDSYGPSEELPRLIGSLEESEDPASEAGYRRLISLVYQQYNCCAATYAVLPYLVEIGSHLEADRSPSLWIDVGHIAATFEPGPDGAPRDLLPNFHAALSAAESKWIEIFLTTDLDALRTYYLAVSLLALSGHPVGRLVKDNFTPQGSAESYCSCPFCSMKIDVGFFDDGISLRSPREIQAAPPKEAQIPAEPKSATYKPRVPNPWEAIASELRWLDLPLNSPPVVAAHIKAATELAQAGSISQADNAAAFSLLGCLLALKGYPHNALRYFHAGDTITCPKCSGTFVFADRWWLTNRA